MEQQILKKFIVTTTINAVTEAIDLFDAMSDWNLIVIGDKKTPPGYHLRRGEYVSPDQQEKIAPALSTAIGWNCIQRRNFGLLLAYRRGADIVAVVDDDNIPLPHWGQDLMIGSRVETNYYHCDQDCFDPIGATNHGHLWHRGFPLQMLATRNYHDPIRKTIVPTIQADFWNGDPDIDAVCRMEHAPECDFDAAAFPIASNKVSPFNSQNTFLARSVIPDYFLYPHVGRMDDIWAAFYVQALGHQVVFGAPSVYQRRNEHDLTVDLSKEIIGYENNHRILADLNRDPQNIKNFLPGKSIYAWQLYREALGVDH
jgi:hypothetical protein